MNYFPHCGLDHCTLLIQKQTEENFRTLLPALISFNGPKQITPTSHRLSQSMLRTLSAFCIITAVKSRKAHLTRHIFSRSIFQCSQKLNMNKKYYKEMYLKFHVGPSLCFRKAHLFTCSPDSSNQVSHGQTLEIYISWTSSCRPSRKQDESCS